MMYNKSAAINSLKLLLHAGLVTDSQRWAGGLSRSDTRPYSDRRSFDRLMLLLAAIAQNPGIGSTKQAQAAGKEPLLLVLAAMNQIATAQGREPQDWAIPTLRKDLTLLRQYGLLPEQRCVGGYRLGVEPLPVLPLPPHRRRSKSKLSIAEMETLQKAGLTHQAIADRAGISKGRVGQMLHSQP